MKAFIILLEVDPEFLLDDFYSLEHIVLVDSWARIQFFQSKKDAEAFIEKNKVKGKATQLPGDYPPLLLKQLMSLNDNDPSPL